MSYAVALGVWLQQCITLDEDEKVIIQVNSKVKF